MARGREVHGLVGGEDGWGQLRDEIAVYTVVFVVGIGGVVGAFVLVRIGW